jgi:hypothetical protein
MQFERAEFDEGPAPPSTCALCGQQLEGAYHVVNERTTCGPCRERLEAHFGSGAGLGGLLKALVLGTLGGLVGAALYFGVARLTGYELSLLAIVVGWLAGKGVLLGNGHRGGRGHQVLAVVLTYGCIAASHVPLLDQAMLEQSGGVTEDAGGDAAEPDDAPFASLPAPVRWAIEWPIALALPVLQATESPMGTLIVLIGLWTAWGTSRRAQLVASGPHALGGGASTGTPDGTAGEADPPPPPA